MPRKAAQSRASPKGNSLASVACGYHNHGVCERAKGCHFRHTADDESIPDSRGKNVCFQFVMGICEETKGGCRYSHDLTFMVPSKKKVKALAKRRQAAGKETDTDEVFRKLEALKAAGPENWAMCEYSYGGSVRDYQKCLELGLSDDVWRHTGGRAPGSSLKRALTLARITGL